jgi:hypothetical protein
MILMKVFRFSFKAVVLLFTAFQSIGSQNVDTNKTASLIQGVVRVVQPGVFDYQSSEYLIRMRAWGVGFPKRNQPGYNEAIHFTEKKLLGTSLGIKIKQEFDLQNIKVVDLYLERENENFSQLAIGTGIGWHIENETGRHGAFVISQLKAKRNKLGIWNYGDLFQQNLSQGEIPHPLLRNMVEQSPFNPGLNYWVTSFGKIHRPGCSFYERGRGQLSRRPTGNDCRICGGTKPR